eukprot:51018_1
MTTYKYIWKIPELSNMKKELICHGYIRQKCNMYIISPIIKLVAWYYSVTQSFSINDIKNAKPLQIFQTSIFSINNIDYYLELHPNGCNKNNIGCVLLFICIAMFPANISKINTQLKLSLLETNTHTEKQYEFNNDKFYIGWNHTKLLFKNIQNLNQFTFELHLKILSIQSEITTQIFPDNNQDFINMKNIELLKSINSPSLSYEYCFESALEKEEILKSEI